MTKAIIIYQSKSGTTKYFGHNIGEYLKSKGIDNSVKSIHDIEPKQVSKYDIVLLGCWTQGLFIALQHPEKEWVNFTSRIPELKNKKIGLFTTYKLATGSMFRKMESPILSKTDRIDLVLKSRSEELNDVHKTQLDQCIESVKH